MRHPPENGKRLVAVGRRNPPLADQLALTERAVAELAFDIVWHFGYVNQARPLAMKIEGFGEHSWTWAPQYRLVYNALLKALGDYPGRKDDTYPDRLAFAQRVEVERVRLEEQRREAQADVPPGGAA